MSMFQMDSNWELNPIPIFVTPLDIHNYGCHDESGTAKHRMFLSAYNSTFNLTDSQITTLLRENTLNNK